MNDSNEKKSNLRKTGDSLLVVLTFSWVLFFTVLLFADIGEFKEAKPAYTTTGGEALLAIVFVWSIFLAGWVAHANYTTFKDVIDYIKNYFKH